MLLLTCHGTIVCLRGGGGGLVHLPLPLVGEDLAPLDVDFGARRAEGERQVHPALGPIVVLGAADERHISLMRYGRFLCAERGEPQMAFDRPQAATWEQFLPLAPADKLLLDTLLAQRWIVESSRRVLRRDDIRLLPEDRLQIAGETVPLARLLPWAADPLVGTMELPTESGTIRLVRAEPGGSALLTTRPWPVRARRMAETLALAAHRQVAGYEPDQAAFDADVRFLLERDGVAGLEDLLERKHAGAQATPSAGAPASAWPAIAQPVVALGTSCIVAYALRRIGLEQPPMPFDWLGTTPAMVLHCLQTDFSMLLDRSQYRSLTGQGREGEPEDGCAHDFYAREYGVARVFNHNDPTRDADYRYTLACVDRFRDLLATPDAKLFVQVAPVSRDTETNFKALAALFDEKTTGAVLVHVAVQPPDPGLAVPLLSAISRQGAHTLYEMQPISRMDGEGFPDAADNECLARTIASHAASPGKVAAPPLPGLRDIVASAEASRSLHAVLLGWAMGEMAHWHRHPVDKAAALARFEALNVDARWAFLYHFENGGVRLGHKPQQAAPNEVQEDRARHYLRFFESVAPMLPADFDTTICVGVGDKVTSKESVPVFGFQKERGAATLLLPDIDFLMGNFYEAPAYDDKRAYAGKIRQAVFAGGTTGGLITPEVARNLTMPRLRAAAYFVGNPDVDFRLPKIVQCTTPEVEAILRAQPFCQTEFLPWDEQLRRRFIISIDGNGATCSRVAISLLSSSVLLKYDSQDVLYYFAGLQPWVHFVPVAEDADIGWIMAQEARHPAAFERIANQGRAFARTYLSRSSAQLYTALLLQLYAASLSAAPIGALRPAPARVTKVERVRQGTHFVAHVQQRGDMPTREDGWNGLPGSTLAIEGFALFLGPRFRDAKLRYQVVLDSGKLSEPGAPGEYRGTRGDNVPVRGLLIDVDDDTPVAVELSYEARFVDGTVMGPVPAGTLCRAESNAALEAFRLVIRKV